MAEVAIAATIKPLTLTREQTAKLLSCSVSTVMRLENEKRLTPLKLRRSPNANTYYDYDEVIGLVKGKQKRVRA